MNKGQRTAGRILDAAESLFARHGFSATVLRDIAEAADIQQPSLYKHFESKDVLYRKVLQRALQPLTEVIEAALIERPTLPELIDRLVDVIAEHPNVPALLIRSILSADAPADDPGLDWVNRLMAAGPRVTRMTEHSFDPALVPLQTVATFNLLFGYFWAAPLIGRLTGADPLSPAMLREQKHLLSAFVSALD